VAAGTTWTAGACPLHVPRVMHGQSPTSSTRAPVVEHVATADAREQQEEERRQQSHTQWRHTRWVVVAAVAAVAAVAVEGTRPRMRGGLRVAGIGITPGRGGERMGGVWTGAPARHEGRATGANPGHQGGHSGSRDADCRCTDTATSPFYRTL